MANLSKTNLESLKRMGFDAKTESEARIQVLKFLEDNEVDGVDDDPIEDLLEFADAFYEEEPIEVKPVKKKSTKKEIVEEDDVEEIDDIEEIDDVEEIDDELADIEAVAVEALEAKKKKEIAAKKVAPVKKTTKNKDHVVFDGKHLEEHVDLIEALLGKVFPKSDFERKWLKQGVTFRALLENTKPTIFNFDALKIFGTGKERYIMGDAYFNRFKSVEDVEAFLPEDWSERKSGMFRGETHPSFKKVTCKDVVLLHELGLVFSESMKRAGSTDVKMGKNRIILEKKSKEGK